jgi:hypothetical protein
VLAQSTSFLLVLAFFAVHVSLLMVKRRDEGGPQVFRVPLIVPLAGAAACAWLAAQYPAAVYLRAGLVGAAALVLYRVAGGTVRSGAVGVRVSS